MKFVLPWAVLKGANHRLSANAMRVNGKWVGRMFLTAEYRESKEAAEQILQQQATKAGWRAVGFPVAIVMQVWEPDRRRRDPSNLQKLVEDAMSGVIYVDDSQIHSMQWVRAGLAKERARIEIEVLPVLNPRL